MPKKNPISPPVAGTTIAFSPTGINRQETMFNLLENRALAPAIRRLVIHAPWIARKRRPGNFVMIRAAEGGERIPITIMDSNAERGTITIVVQVVGRTTRRICSEPEGGSLLDVVGPLGRPTPILTTGEVACIGGGVGTAEVYPIAGALRDAGNRVFSIVGARTQDLVILREEMESCSEQLIVTTDDGSAGRQGFVTDALRDLLSDRPGISAVYAIGPLPMMKAVSDLTRPAGIRTFVSLNTIMVDGTGMCGGCRVTVGGRMKFACVDGPEFDGHDVDFDELLLRSRSYLPHERMSDERHRCRLADAAGEVHP